MTPRRSAIQFRPMHQSPQRSGGCGCKEEHEWAHRFELDETTSLCWAGQKVPVCAVEQGILCWSRYTKCSWLNKSLKVDGSVCVSANPVATAKQVKFRITELCSTEGTKRLPFCSFSHRLQLLFFSLLPLRHRMGNVNVMLVIALRPVLVCTKKGVKASHVSFGWCLGECGSKWEASAKMLSTPASSSPAFYSNHSRRCWPYTTSKHFESQI